MPLTFVDTGILIAAARGAGEMQRRAQTVLFDPDRQFASSAFVRLETLPKPLYFGQQGEVTFYREFFRRVAVWARPTDELIVAAYREAATRGMAAMDALHVAAAIQVGAEELATTERPTKPIHRARGVRVVTIYEQPA